MVKQSSTIYGDLRYAALKISTATKAKLCAPRTRIGDLIRGDGTNPVTDIWVVMMMMENKTF